MLVAWKPRRANSAAAVVDDLLLAAVVALAERGWMLAAADIDFVTSVRYKSCAWTSISPTTTS